MGTITSLQVVVSPSAMGHAHQGTPFRQESYSPVKVLGNSLSRRDVVSGMILLAVVISVASFFFPSVAVSTYRTVTGTGTRELVFPGYTSTTTSDTTLFHKVAMTNTITVTSELVYTDLKTMPVYSVLGLGDAQVTFLVILIVAAALLGITSPRRKPSC
jgi:hypothetical protein